MSGGENYVGVCHGGPYDGRSQVHFSDRIEIAMCPAIAFMSGTPAPDEALVIEHGYYEHQDGIWTWHPPIS